MTADQITHQRKLARLLKQANTAQGSKVTAAEAVEFRREAYGLTKTDMALVIGIQKSHYTEFTQGERSLTVAQIRRAVLVGVPASALLNLRIQEPKTHDYPACAIFRGGRCTCD